MVGPSSSWLEGLPQATAVPPQRTLLLLALCCTVGRSGQFLRSRSFSHTSALAGCFSRCFVCSCCPLPSTAPPAPLEATYQLVELTSGLDMSRTNMHDVGGGVEHGLPINFIDRPVSRRAALFRVYAEEPLFVNGSVSFASLQSQVRQGKSPLTGTFLFACVDPLPQCESELMRVCDVLCGLPDSSSLQCPHSSFWSNRSIGSGDAQHVGPVCGQLTPLPSHGLGSEFVALFECVTCVARSSFRAFVEC